MATGIITTMRDGGFGFIARDAASNRPDLFFHRSAVRNNAFVDLQEGQPVGYYEEPDPRDVRRRRAVDVHSIVSVFDASPG